MRQDNSFVGDFVIFLAQKWNSSATQLYNQSLFIDDFGVAFSQLPLAFDSSGNLFVSIETFSDPGADSDCLFHPDGREEHVRHRPHIS